MPSKPCAASSAPSGWQALTGLMVRACRAKFFSLYSTVLIQAPTRFSSSGEMLVTGFTVRPSSFDMDVSCPGPDLAHGEGVSSSGCCGRGSGRGCFRDQNGALTSFQVGLFTAMSTSRAKTEKPW